MTDKNKFTKVGSTRDDAAGEAFDKVAKLLGLSYPGGPEISKRANLGNSKAYSFPRPMIAKGLDFSFSGLKTDVLRLVKRKNNKFSEQEINNICASFQAAVIDVLITKTIRAAEKYQAKMITIGGGVSSNQLLRKFFTNKITSQQPQIKFILPDPKYSTDNAAMVAAAGYHLAQQKKFTQWDKLAVDPNLSV
jgi:N6-L-threonylcarbamoyladenine synthase